MTDKPTPTAEQLSAPKAAPGEPPGIQALMCVISSLHSLRDTAHFSDEEGELTNDLCTLRDWAYAQTAAFQPSPKAAPEVGNSGFDHKTAADFLSGKTVIVEALREFVHASRRAHDEKTALSAMLLSVRGVLTSREAEIALLKKALLEAEAAPQPAPAPLSDDTKRLDWMDKDACERVLHVGADWYTRPTYGQPHRKHKNLRAAIDAALAAQGGKCPMRIEP